MFNYPNPCETCTECDGSQKCQRWRMRFLTIWKQFNTYQIRQYKKSAGKQKAFAYEHPDVLRRYLENGPCKGCEFEVLCDVPCTAYYAWWDAKMAVLRKKYNAEKRNSDGSKSE